MEEQTKLYGQLNVFDDIISFALLTLLL